MDHYDIPDVTDADSIDPDDYFRCSDPWGDFKWWMYTEKIRQIMLDYFWQHDHSYNVNPKTWFERMGLKTIDFSLASDLLPEVLTEIREAHADIAAEEEALIEEDAHKDPMYRLLQTIDAAMEFGCENDKSFAWEGIDLLKQESVDEHCGDGDPSQWTY